MGKIGRSKPQSGNDSTQSSMGYGPSATNIPVSPQWTGGSASPNTGYFTQPFTVTYMTDLTEPMTPEEREGAIEFLEELMFVICAMLDEHDVPNKGGVMDRSEGAKIEAKIDLGEYEIILQPKR